MSFIDDLKENSTDATVKFLIKTIGAMVLFMDIDDAIMFKKVLDEGPTPQTKEVDGAN